MKLEVLISTMYQTGFSKLIRKMKIKSDAIFINQSDSFEYSCINNNNNNIKIFTFPERGIGLSRNNALMRAEGDICLLADDDVILDENYYEIIIKAYEEHPEADVILFNVPSLNHKRPTVDIKKKQKIHHLNYMKYGAVNITFRTKKIQDRAIYFSLAFGGGAKYSAGEDTLFLHNCLEKKLKIVALPKIIGWVEQKDSTWFEGYNKKYFFDKGIFFSHLSKRNAYLLALQFLIRKHKLYKDQISFNDAFKKIIEGIKNEL
ncbi:glycosyltransferase family A protein [Exiguobacterium sp. s142]|uniref:glycosyltransferase family A protein n=1 Tax=Exiguobacterium sp. s142 TaxID=2751222 RepID=UPI001BE55576|nr:glycosyltransferase family A protein [Exiguobacterium sp. s142]